MALQTGTLAPDFTLKSKTPEGLREYTLSHYRGKNVVLLFVPLAFTGVCTKELCTISQGVQAYESLNAEVFGISVDSPFAQEAWAKESEITIPLLSDFNRTASRSYDCLYENFLPDNLGLQGVSKRSAYVIDNNGVIQYAEVLENAGSLPDFDRVVGALKQL